MTKQVFHSLAMVPFVFLSHCALVYAGDFTGNVLIERSWARATVGQASVGVAYSTLIAHDKKDWLVGASTPVSDKAEIHSHTFEDEIMKMRPVDRLELAPGEIVMLHPGGTHIMLMALRLPLEEGSSFPLTFVFKHSGSVTANVVVASPSAMGPD